MRIAAFVVTVALAVAGCSSAQVNVQAGTAGTVSTPASGTTVSGGSVGVHAHGGRGLATVLIAIGLIAGMVEYSREERPFPSPSTLIPGNTQPVPEMAPERRIAEQDCTRPIDLSAGNLRCK
jgi:hypothetical protein